MKNSKLFITSLIAAAAMTFRAQAEDINLSTTATELEKTTTAGQGNIYTASGTESLDAPTGVISWGTLEQALGLDNIGFAGKLSGTGTVLFGFSEGNGGRTVTINVANNSLDSFSGALTFVNTWNSNTLVKLNGGTGTQNIHYLFGGVSQEKGWSNKRMYGQNATNMCNDTLELTGNTTLAGITGTSKGYSQGSVSNVNQKEHLNVATTNTVLTLAGGGNYSFYGTVGTATNRVGINKTGTGTQVLGGNLFLGSVTVTAGTLDLSGATVSLSNMISNSGTVTVSSATVFNLNFDAGSDNFYTVINGGTINGWDSNTLSSANFTLNGEELGARQTANVSQSGKVSISGQALSIVWAGTAENNTWNADSTNQPWLNGSTASDFQNADDVTFSSTATNKTVNIAADVTAGTITIGGGEYIFERSGNTGSVTSKNGLFIESGATLIINSKLGDGQKALVRGEVTVKNGGLLKFAVNDATGWGGTTSDRMNILNVEKGGTVHLGHSSNETFAGTLNLGGTVSGDTDSRWDIFERNSVINVTSDSAVISTNLNIRRDNAVISLAAGTALTISGNITVGHGGADTLKVDATGAASTSSSFAFTGGTGTIGSGVHLRYGSFTIGDGTKNSVLSLGRLEMGDGNGINTGTSTLTVNKNATLKITGNNNTYNDYKNVSAIIGEWGVSTAATIEGTLLAKEANLSLGDSGGSLNIGGIVAANGIGQAKITSGKFDLTLNDGGKVILGDAGISTIKTNNNVTFNAGEVGMYEATTTIETNVKLNSATGTTFNTQKYAFATNGNSIALDTADVTGGTMTISGILSDGDAAGKLIKEGVGILILNAANTFSGGVAINAGTVQAGNASALGTGAVKIDGGQLNVASGVALNQTAIEIVLSDKYKSDSGVAAITGSGSITLNGNKINLSKGELDSLTIATEMTFKIADASISSSFTKDNFMLGTGWDGWTITSYANGVITLSVPEPSMFGLLAGLGALALVGARRRRKTK